MKEERISDSVRPNAGLHSFQDLDLEYPIAKPVKLSFPICEMRLIHLHSTIVLENLPGAKNTSQVGLKF